MSEELTAENDADLITAFRRSYTWDRTDPIIAVTACPACDVGPGLRCRTVIDGTDTGWTHDARVFAHMGVRGGSRALPPGGSNA